MHDRYLLKISNLIVLIAKWNFKVDSGVDITLISGGNYNYVDREHDKIFIYIQDTSNSSFLNGVDSSLLKLILNSFEELNADYIKHISPNEILVCFIDNPKVSEPILAKNVVINSIRDFYDINNIIVSNEIDRSIETIYYEHVYQLREELKKKKHASIEREGESKVIEYDIHMQKKSHKNINKKVVIIPTILAIVVVYLFTIDPTLINNLLGNVYDKTNSLPSQQNTENTLTIDQPNNPNPNQNPNPNPTNEPTIDIPAPTQPTTPPSSTPLTISAKSYTHEELVQHALELINTDRVKHGLPPVTLGNNIAAQRHAEDMLKYRYISHWDSDGFKPYMRYTQYNGKGEVSENVAVTGYYNNDGSTDCYSSFVLCEKIDPKDAISKLHYAMVYDDADSNWGHRDNILNRWHNKVNIGIAYDDYFIALVQQFENDYVEWDALHISNSYAVQSGRISTSISQSTKLIAVAIYYDPLPQKMSTLELNNTPHCYSYGGGVKCGSEPMDTIYPPPPAGYYYTGPNLHIADKWIVDDNYFYIEYSVRFTDDGVYTFVLIAEVDGEQIPLASYSIGYKNRSTINIGQISK